MDDYVKDNKNHSLLAFLSLLTTREMFEEVELGFLVVGHTHEELTGALDICQKSYILIDLMRVFMIS
jgi:hypothetical protein